MRLKSTIVGLIMLTVFTVCSAISYAEGAGKMIPAGEDFVDFELEAHDGTTVSSASLEGRPYLLFFYPKAETPG